MSYPEKIDTYVIGIGIPMIPLLHLLSTLIILPKLLQHIEYFGRDLHLFKPQGCIVDHTLWLSQIHLETILFAVVACIVIVMTT